MELAIRIKTLTKALACCLPLAYDGAGCSRVGLGLGLVKLAVNAGVRLGDSIDDHSGVFILSRLQPGLGL